MDNKVQTYVEGLFRGYEDTPALQDFKEEITSNLYDRIHDLENNGMDANEAFTKAVAELGDITSIADEISRQKRNEVIERMYIQPKTEVGLKHAIGYVLAGGVFLFGVITAFITYFSTQVVFHGVSAFLPFIVLSGAAFVFLGLTQETSRNVPMSWKRAIIYALSTGAVLFGLTNAAMLYFMDNRELNAVLGTMIPFVIPGLGLLAFLILTEKSRNKPWVIEEQKLMMAHYAESYSDPRRMEQRGLLSGALWMASIALFVLLGFTVGFKYAWIVFLFTIAAEVFIEFLMHTRLIRK